MKILFLSIIAIGLYLRISKNISDHKFTKHNKDRLKRRLLMKQQELNKYWVDELLDEIFLKTNKIKQ